MVIEIYSDGSCLKNPGPGAYCAAIFDNNQIIVLSEFFHDTTNNRMELLGAIKALEHIAIQNNKSSDLIIIHTDSQYVKNGIESWIFNWQKNNWKTANNKPVKNQDLWEKLYQYNSIIKPKWNWVKGHSTDEFNNMVDFIANYTAKQSKTPDEKDMSFFKNKFSDILSNPRQIKSMRSNLT